MTSLPRKLPPLVHKEGLEANKQAYHMYCTLEASLVVSGNVGKAVAAAAAARA